MSRVLHVVTSMSVGGIQTYLLNVLRHYDRARFHMDVCFTGAGPGCHEQEVLARGSRLMPCRYSNALLPFVWRLARVLEAGRYDAVCDFTGDFAAGSMAAGRLAGVPTRVAFYRSSGIQFRPTSARRAVARCLHHAVVWNATQVLSNSESNLARAFAGTSRPVDRCAVVYNGVDLDRFVPLGDDVRRLVRAELHLPADACVIGHVGSFTPPKAQEVLVRAFARLRPSHPRARLLLVGDGPLRRDVEDEARRLDVRGAVAFAGLRADVPRLLNAMDVFVLPSRFEGFPNALIEAQAMGLPVIASDRPEIREAMPRENHDSLVAVGDAAALERILGRCLEDAGWAAGKGAIGASFVRTHLDISQSVEAFCRFLVRTPLPCAS
jgi:glycosyltransferase involved in cell wall biosynthesis